MTVTVAIDCMGGDHGPKVTVPAALAFAQKHADVRVVLVGREEDIRPHLSPTASERISVRHADEVAAQPGEQAERVPAGSGRSGLVEQAVAPRPLQREVLRDLGVASEDIPILAQNALLDPCIATNPCTPSREDIAQIYESAL